MEKLFLVEIDSLDQGQEGCYASNAHFSEMFDISKGRCSQIIKSLEEKKLIKVDLERRGKMVSKRVIKVVSKLNTLFNKLNTLPEFSKHPYLENAQGNNTSINNTKERESRALDFLQKNYPSRFEAAMMQYKSSITNFNKFREDFNDTVDQEELAYTDRVLFARLGKYARNWIENQTKQTLKEEGPKPAYLRKIS